MWNAQNASHIHTASTAATGSNPMPNQNSTNNLPDFQFRKVRKKLDTTDSVLIEKHNEKGVYGDLFQSP